MSEGGGERMNVAAGKLPAPDPPLSPHEKQPVSRNREFTATVTHLSAARLGRIEGARGVGALLADDHSTLTPFLEPDQGATIGVPGQIAKAGGAGELPRVQRALPQSKLAFLHGQGIKLGSKPHPAAKWTRR